MDKTYSIVKVWLRGEGERNFSNAHAYLSPMETVLYVELLHRGTKAYNMNTVDRWSF